MDTNLLLTVTYDLTFTVLAPAAGQQLAQVHSTQLNIHSAPASLSMANVAVSRPVTVWKGVREHTHHCHIVYIAVASHSAIWILDLRIVVCTCLVLSCLTSAEIHAHCYTIFDIQVSPGASLKVQSFWHQSKMPRQRTADQKDPETYPEQPRMDCVEAVAFIPRTGQYLLLGACHLALLWSRSGSICQKDVMTVELIVGDIQATTKTPKLLFAAKPADAAPVRVQSTLEARIGPWMLLCASTHADWP